MRLYHKYRHGFVALLLAALLLAGCASGGASESSVSGQGSSEVPAVSQQDNTSSQSQEASAGDSSEAENPSGGEHVTPANAVSESSPVEPSFFDDAVFIGDSVSLKLQLYIQAQKQQNNYPLGQAQFLTAGSLGSGNALWEVSDKSVHPTYQGTKMLLEDAVAASGAQKVYIMLGMNDVGLYGIDQSVDNMQTLLKNIQAKSPNAVFYVQSATPMVDGRQQEDLNNANLTAYNEKLAAMCATNGYNYIDVASVLTDETGGLIREYCSDPDDMGIHFTDTGCQVWIDYLAKHTGA